MHRHREGSFGKAGVFAFLGLVVAVAAWAQGGGAFAWGDNQHGQLGDGTPLTSVPGQTLNLTGVTKIAAGGSHSLALKNDGTV
jgi:alpha-tubulin suppressor-like RCC1 family protein